MKNSDSDLPNAIANSSPTLSSQLIDQSNPILIINASFSFYKTKICPYFLMVLPFSGKMH